MIKQVLVAITFVSIIHLPSKGACQNYTSSMMLNAYKNDLSLPLYDEYVNGVNSMRFKIPLVEEVNLRTESDQFDFGRQEYAVRTMFNGFNESKYYNLEKSSLTNLKQIEKSEREKSALYEKYKDIIQLKYNIEKIPIIDSLEIQYNQRLNQLIRSISIGEFIDPKDVLKIEENLYDLSQKRKSAIVAIESSKSKLNLGKNSSIDFDDWITLNVIEKIYPSLVYKVPTTIDQKFAESNLRYQSKYMMENANNKRILDYAQLRYSKRDNLLFQDEFSIGVGLRLPYQGSNIKSKNDYLLKKNELQFEKNTKSIQGEEDFKRDMATLESLIAEAKFYITTNEKIFKVLNESHLESALAIINAKKMIELTNKEKRLELGEKITLYFINLIQDADKLIELPLKNYLTDKLSNL